MSRVHRGVMPSQSPQAKQLRIELAENKLCSIVGKLLADHYPGWTWDVDCTLPSGLVNVRCLNIHGKYGFSLLIKDVDSPHAEAVVVYAAGELFERCGIPRGKKPEELIVERDIQGNVKNIDTYTSGGEY